MCLWIYNIRDQDKGIINNDVVKDADMIKK